MRASHTIALLLLAATFVGAKQPPSWRTYIEGVRIDVLVSDGGRPLTGLQADDFEVLDNGVRQRPQLATVAGVVNVALLLDISYSVVDGGHLSDLTSAARTFLTCLAPSDSAALLTFSRGTRLVVSTTLDRNTIVRALDFSPMAAPRRAGDGTAMWDAIVAASSVVVGQSGRSAVLLLSDAGENASWLFTNQPEDARWMRNQRVRTIDALRGSGVAVDVVSIPRYRWTWSAHDGSYGRQNPSEPADLTDGVMFQASDKDLRASFSRRLELLRSSYILTYSPTGVEKRQGWHKLSVRLKNKRGKVQARSGYFADVPRENLPPR